MSTNVGSARFDVTANPAQAIRAVRELAREAQRLLGGVSLTPRLDKTTLLSDLRKAVQGAAVQAQVTLGIKPLAQADLDRALGKLKARQEVTVDVRGDAVGKIAEIKAKLAELKSTAADVVKVDASTLTALVAQLKEQVKQLNALETSLRSLRLGSGGTGGNGGGAGGGSPGSNPYAAQLQAWRTELKAGTTDAAGFKAGLMALQTALQNDVNALRALGVLTADDARKLDQMKAALGGVNQELNRLTAASQSSGVAQLARDLQVAQSKFERGELSLRGLLREMGRIKTEGAAMGAGLAAGSREAQNLERIMRGLSGGAAKINDQSIVKLRADMAAARAEFERATAAAGRFGEKRAAVQAFEQAMRSFEQTIAKVGARTTLTTKQLGELSRLSAQIGSQRNALNNVVSGAGLSGSILASLRQLPQLASVAGGSLGAMASQATAVGGGLAAIIAQAGPVGFAIGAIGAAAIAATAALISLGRTGLAEVAKLQQGMNILQANGEQNLSGITEQVKALQDSLGAVGGAFTRGDLTQATADIVKAGVSSADALTLMSSSARLAAAEQINLRDASGQLLKNLRQYDMGVTDAGRVADMLAKAGNLAAGSANDLSVGFGIVGTTGKQAKLEMYDLLGMLVELDNKGMSAADVGANGLRAAIAALSDVTKKGERSLATLGVKIRDEFGHAKPAGDLLKELGSNLRGMGVELNRATGQLDGNGDALNIVTSVMDNRAAAAVLGLTGDWKEYGQQVKNSTDYHKEYAEIMQQGVQPALQSLRTAWKDAGGELVSSFAGPLADLLNNSITPGIKQMGDFFTELRRGGPVLDELKGYVYALIAALVTLKGVAAAQSLYSLLGGAIGLRSIIPTLIAGFAGLRVAALGFFSSVAGAGSVSAAFGIIRTAVVALGASINTALIGATAAVSGLTLAVGGAVALAATVNKLQGDLQGTYDQIDQGNQKSFEAVMARVRALMAENTELSRAKAEFLLLTQQLSDAQQGDLKGVNLLGERIYGPPDEARINKLQADLQAARQNITLLTTEGERHAAAAKTQQQTVVTSLKLTDDQLKKQQTTIKELRAELGKPVKLFGGTEFQGQLDQIAEKYRQLKDKLRQDVLDPKQRNELSRHLTARQGQETGQVRTEYSSRAGDAAGTAERQVQQARVNAMAEGSARIRAQAALDITEIRRTAQESAKAWRDFPKEKARILAAGEAQVRQVQTEANRQVLEADRKLAEERKREAQRQLRERQAAEAVGARFKNTNDDFQLALSKGKITDSSLQNYQQAIRALRAEVEKMPPAWQKLFNGLITDSKRLDTAGQGSVKLAGTLAEVRGRLKDMSLAELQATRSRYANVAAAQALITTLDGLIRKQREAAATRQGQLQGKFQNLNQDFQVRVEAGKVDLSSLTNYRQAVSALRAEIGKLPPEYQSVFVALQAQAKQLDASGRTVALARQQAANYEAGLKKLKGAVGEWSAAELQAALSRVQGVKGQERTVKLLQDEIDRRRKLTEVTLEQGRLSLQKGDAQAVVENYEARKTAAQGNAAELLRIEQQLGAEVLAARQRLAQIAAREEVIQVQEQYRNLREQAKGNAETLRELDEQEAALILQIRSRRNAAQLANKVASDQALITQAETTTAELIRLENERQDGIDAVRRAQAEGSVGRYELAGAQAGDDLAARLLVEEEWEQRVRASRQELASLSAEADIRAQTEKYRVLVEKAKGNAEEQRRLQAELNDWIIGRNHALATETERIAFETGQARVKAQQALNDQLLRLDRELRDGLTSRAQAEATRRREQYETDLGDDLRAAGDNEAARLQILQRAEVARIQLSRQGVNARVAAERDAENRRFDDLRAQAVRDGTWALRGEQLEREHQARLTEITTQGETEQAQEIRRIRQETESQNQRVQERAAQETVKALTRNLSDMTLVQRQQARLSLEGWLTTFRAMGVAGQAAAKTIQDALDGVAQADSDARARAVDLADKLFEKDEGGRFLRPDQVAQRLSSRTNKIGKPDTEADAVAKGSEQYTTEIASLKKGITDAQKTIAELGKLPASSLNALEAQSLRMAREYLAVFEAQLPKTQQAALDAGQKAGRAFMDGLAAALIQAQDAAADAALGLAEANLKLAQSRGLDGSFNYNAALRQYRDYWQGRMAVLQQGLADAQAAETAARATLAGATTPEARTAAQTALTAAMAGTAAAQAQLSQATTNYVQGQEKVLDNNKLLSEGERALAGARDGLAQVMGQSVLLYQSELSGLDELIKKYPAQAEALGRVRAEYERIQQIRAAGITTKDSLKLDFQMGQSGGAAALQNSISGVAKGFGQLMSPLQIFSAILDKINPAGMILEGMFSVLEEPIKALQEPFKVIGTLLGSVIAPILELIAPVLTLVADLFTVLYDAIAAFIKAITFGLVNIDRRTPSSEKEKGKEKDQYGTPLAAVENDLADLELLKRKKLISDEDYFQQKQALVLKQLGLQRQQEIAGAEGNAEAIAQIDRKYDRLEVEARTATQEELDRIALESSARNREIAGLDAEAELADLERRHRQRLVGDREYEEEKYRLTVARLNRERAAEIAAAEGNGRKIAAINRKYDGQILDAKLDMLDKLSEAYRQIGDTLLGSVTGSIRDGLLAALRAGNFAQFRSGFRKNLREAMFEAVVSAAIETAALKGILQPAIDALTAAFQTEDTADDDAAIAGLLAAGSKVEGKVRQIYKALKPLRDAWGIKGDEGGPQTMEVTGNVSAPEVRVSLDMLSYLADTIQRDVPPWRDAIALHTPALKDDAAALLGHTPALTGHTAGLGAHVPALAAHTAALPQFSTAVDQFGLHEQAYQASALEFGGHVTAFGGHVASFGGHVRVLADAVRSGESGFNPKR